MKSERNRHRFDTQIGHGHPNLEDSAGKPLGDLVFMCEGPLGHQIRVFPELKLAGYVRGVAVGTNLGDLPVL